MTIRSISAKHAEVTQALLQDKQINLSLVNNEDRTVFGVALANKDEDIAKAILEHHKGAAEETNSRGMTFLHTAVSAGDVDSVHFLLQVGVNVNTPVRDPSQRTALSLAVTNGHVQIVDMLLRARANYAIPEPSSKWTPLHLAAALGHVEIVDCLVKAGTDASICAA